MDVKGFWGWVAFAIMVALFIYTFVIRELQQSQQVIVNTINSAIARITELEKKVK